MCELCKYSYNCVNYLVAKLSIFAEICRTDKVCRCLYGDDDNGLKMKNE